MKRIVAINKDKRETGRDYTFGGRCQLIETRTFVDQAPAVCEVAYLHANDVRGNSALRKLVLAWAKKGNTKVVLFTNGQSRGANVQDFPDSPVFTWEQIQTPFPDLPSSEVVHTHLVALAILCQGYLAARGHYDCAPKDEASASHFKQAQERASAVVVHPEWWRQPFSEHANLKTLLVQECRSALPTEVERLLDCIQGTVDFGPEQDVLVSNALRTILPILNG